MIEIPGYTVLRLLGHGGMATVYLALQQSLRREVALKILTPALASDPVATERFLREARVSAKLHHPNIVAIFDVGVHEGVPYMSIAYEPGGTVAGYTQARNDPKIALRIIRDIANALDFAHRQGVIHRDVKPENILLRNDGTCVLSDFGIAHAVEGSQTGLTREGTSVGTPHYMSPEQLRGEHVDARADIYSLGVVLYQLLTGELPYQGTDGWAIGMQHISAPIPHLPPHLDYLQTFLDSLLAKDPARRLQSGAEVVHWVDARLSGSGPALTVAMPTPMPPYSPTPPGARGAASLAILPFADMSQGKDQEYLAEGLTEELLNLLAKTPGLFVASRSSAARFKGSSAKLAEIGRELKVATVLEGSVRKFGDRVRISVQLINVADGFQRWSETYDRTLTDVFAVQDEIAALVVIALKEQLLPDVEAEAAKKAAREQEEKTAAQAREHGLAEQREREELDRAATEEQRQREIGERILAKKREREEAERLAAEKKQRDEQERAAEEQRQREQEAQAAEARKRREAEQRATEAERQRLAAERAVVEQRAAAERAEAERLAAEQRRREDEARAAAEAQRRAEQARAAEEQRRREEAELAEASRRKRDADERAAAEQAAAEQAAAQRAAIERAAAERVAVEKAELERIASQRAAALMAPAAAPTADDAAEPARDPAREFASAYLAKPEPAQAAPTAARSEPRAPSAITPARIGTAVAALLVLAVGGWLLMQNIQQKNQVACQAALLQGQTAADAGDFDKAAVATLDAHGVCGDSSDELLSALDGRIRTGKALAQTCGAAAMQARELLRAGKPKAAAETLAPAHAECAAYPGYPELEALPSNAQAQALELVRRAAPLMQSGAYPEAQALVEQALSMDAEAPGLAEMNAQLSKKLSAGRQAAAATAAPAAAPTPPPPVAAPATSAAAAALAAKQAANERVAKLEEEKARKAAEQKTAAVAAAAAGKRASSTAPVGPVAAPVAAPVAPAPLPTPVVPPPASTSSGHGNDLVATSTPQPPYPPQALRGKVSGEVTVSFVVNTDGSVGKVRIVSARPRGVFDRGVLSAVGRWRFQPVDQPQPAQRTITFRP